MSEVVVAAGARTPIGRLLGSLADLSAPASTVNKLCPSGLASIAPAAQFVATGSTTSWSRAAWSR